MYHVLTVVYYVYFHILLYIQWQCKQFRDCIFNFIALASTSSLERKVDKMEHSIGSIIAKLDAVLVRTGVMQEQDGNITLLVLYE